MITKALKDFFRWIAYWLRKLFVDPTPKHTIKKEVKIENLPPKQVQDDSLYQNDTQVPQANKKPQKRVKIKPEENITKKDDNSALRSEVAMFCQRMTSALSPQIILTYDNDPEQPDLFTIQITLVNDRTGIRGKVFNVKKHYYPFYSYRQKSKIEMKNHFRLMYNNYLKSGKG